MDAIDAPGKEAYAKKMAKEVELKKGFTTEGGKVVRESDVSNPTDDFLRKQFTPEQAQELMKMIKGK